MTVYDLKDTQGRVFAFEIDNVGATPSFPTLYFQLRNVIRTRFERET